MTDQVANRAVMLDELRQELFGPSPAGRAIDVTGDVRFESPVDSYGPWRQLGSGEEILDRDSPTKRYGVGVLFPQGAQLNEAGQPDSAGEPGDEDDLADSASGEDVPEPEEVGLDPSLDADIESLGEAEDDDLDLSLANVYQPSVLGVSFLAKLPEGAELIVRATGGRYTRKPVSIGPAEKRMRPRNWWLRHPVELSAELSRDELLAPQVRRPARWVTGMVEGAGLDLWFEIYSRPHGAEPDQRLITLCLVNRTNAPAVGNLSEHCLFQTHFSAEIRSPDGLPCTLPYPGLRAIEDEEEESLELLYRDSRTFATGHGCSADWRPSDDPERAWAVSAECLPAVETPNITANVTEDEESQSQVGVDMAALAGLRAGDDGTPSMGRVVDLYERWLGRQAQRAEALDTKYAAAARRHLDACWAAARRMRDGLEYLREDPRARHAFQLANHAILLQQINSDRQPREVGYDTRGQRLAFAPAYTAPDPLAAPPGRGTWRAFQIGFLLASLRSAADGEASDRETVDLIWFPTGGGKTEAYLGLAAFAMFKRRLAGPNDAGVNVLMRYTSRLLTAQQFQRASALMCAMEYLRQTGMDNLGDEPFQAGIWLGGETTPNTRESAVRAWRELRSHKAGPNKFLLTRCPWCAAKFGRREYGIGRNRQPFTPGYDRRRTPDGREETIVFACPDSVCPFHGQLPIVVVDEDIYERRPTLIIGTIDKFAMLAWRPEAASLFGLGADGQRLCSPPGLIIQDELHLISGPLGSLAGLYETVIEELCTDRRDGRLVVPKIVCSTATIRGFASQAQGLYARDTVALFPPPELDAGKSFFAREQRPGRLYVGVHAPSLGSVQTEWVRTCTALLLAPGRLAEEGRDPWWTMLVFFNSLREMGTAHTLFDTDVRDYAKVIWSRQGPDAVRRYLSRLFELTGGLASDDVSAAIARLELPYTTAGNASVDVCLASSVIEVGIDIQRLGLIVVAGQPKTTAQYIQVTGRVGRSEDTPGLVVAMYSPSKPRDRSHFERFRSYHEQLYGQVEPTSVTPFSGPALERALHAVLVAYVRQTGGATLAASPYPYPEDLVRRFASIALGRLRRVDPAEEPALQSSRSALG